MDGYPGRGKYRAPYGANKIRLAKGKKIRMTSVGIYTENCCHLLADEIVKQNLPLALPGVGCEGKPIKGADVHINFRPEAKIVRNRISYRNSGNNKQTNQRNKPNKWQKLTTN